MERLHVCRALPGRFAKESEGVTLQVWAQDTRIITENGSIQSSQDAKCSVNHMR